MESYKDPLESYRDPIGFLIEILWNLIGDPIESYRGAIGPLSGSYGVL